jgi:hypothetical protein
MLLDQQPQPKQQKEPGICNVLGAIGAMSIVVGLLLALVGLISMVEGGGVLALVIGLSSALSGTVFLGFEAIIHHLYFIRLAVEGNRAG